MAVTRAQMLTREQSEELVELLLRIPVTSTYSGRTALLADVAIDGLIQVENNARLHLAGVVAQLDRLQARDALATLIANAIAYARTTPVADDLAVILQAVKKWPPSLPNASAPSSSAYLTHSGPGERAVMPVGDIVSPSVVASGVSVDEILKIHAAAIAAYLPNRRVELLAGIPEAIIDALPPAVCPSAQILSDLYHINDAGRAAEGRVPLELWLLNALGCAFPWVEGRVFQTVLKGLMMGHRNAKRRRDAAIPFRRLSRAALRSIHEAAMACELFRMRNVLLGGVDANLVRGLPRSPSASAQMSSDLRCLNEDGVCADGGGGMQTWLSNAIALAGMRQEAVAFRSALRGGFGLRTSADARARRREAQMLTTAEFQAIHGAAARMGLARARTALLAAMPLQFVYTLVTLPEPHLQLENDLLVLNKIERLTDNSIPLRLWLRNARDLACSVGRKESEVFENVLLRLARDGYSDAFGEVSFGTSGRLADAEAVGDPLRSSPGDPSLPQADFGLLDALVKLMPSQFDLLIYEFGVPQHHLPGPAAPLASRVIALLMWADQQSRRAELERLCMRILHETS